MTTSENDVTEDDGDFADAGLSDALKGAQRVDAVEVRLSNEMVHLLSEQLYASPVKAIEELVANAYDADASECRIALFLQEKQAESVDGVVAIYDNGTGMGLAQLQALWQVGASPKRELGDDPVGKHNRLMIGKFGIGKLATYAVANRITYVTSSKDEGVLHVVCDFQAFSSEKSEKNEPISLEVTRIGDLSTALKRDDFSAVLARLGLKAAALERGKNWTVCLLDNLKPKALELKVGRLAWVLRTAMPLKSDFSVFLDGKPQTSSKEDAQIEIEADIGALEIDRIKELNRQTGMSLFASTDGKSLKEPKFFPKGIHGSFFITKESLKGKSDRFGRSFGFFIRVRGRLVNVDDPLFHNQPFSFSTFNRFRCDLDIDDLHPEITAPREGVRASERREMAVAITHAILLQARSMYEAWLDKNNDQKQTREDVRVYVAEHLVERPMADVLATHGSHGAGGEVDRGWIYMQDVPEDTLGEVVKQLYEERSGYVYKRVGLGKSGKIARFDPSSAAFTINEDHHLVKAFDDEPLARELINLVATAEVMLEVYLAESDIDPFTIGDILNRRDILLRSLANDRVFSRTYIAGMLRESRDSDIDLELALVAAARALGFQVSHIAGSGEPDGVARFLDTTMTETKITLEAKSSAGTPSLHSLDFAGLVEHKAKAQAAGCLLVAPIYPGSAKEGGAVASRAAEGRISCWTIEQLARVVADAERLEITAQRVAGIVTTRFTPQDVSAAVEALFAEGVDMTTLYGAIMDELARMFSRRTSKGTAREINLLLGALQTKDEFADLSRERVEQAVKNLAAHSKGGMVLNRDSAIIFLDDFEEVVRRVASLTGSIGGPRSLGTFTFLNS